MRLHTCVCICLLTCLQIFAVARSEGKVKLEKLSTVYLPRRFSDDGSIEEFEFESGTVESFGYDKSRQLAYLTGSENLYVVSVRNPNNLTVVHKQSMRNSFFDVDFCGGFVIAASVNEASDMATLQIYREYNEVTNTVELLQEITLPGKPDQTKPTSDCKKIVVTIEGEKILDDDDKVVSDPPGEIVIFSVPPRGDLSDMLKEKRLDFKDFDGWLEELQEQGFIQTFFGEDGNNPLSNDVEPEHIDFDKDEKFAYVSLQENNGIAIVDLRKHEIVNIFGLGVKKFVDVRLDPSDRDGAINLIPRPELHGWRSPDVISVTHIMGEEFIVTANEGEDSVGTVRLSEVTLDPNVFPNAEFLQRPENLGRLRTESILGDTDGDGLVDKIFFSGTRGFSLFNAWDGKLEYDSDDLLATNFAAQRPDIFNANVEGEDTLAESFDQRSDARGLEPEHVSAIKVGDHILIILGLERPGCIATFVIDTMEIPTKSTFEDLYCNVPMRPNATWEELYEERVISELGVEEIRVIRPEDSPTGEALLLAIGTDTGTLSSFRINFREKSTTESTTRTTPTTPTTTRTTTTRRPKTPKPKRRFRLRQFKGRRRFGSNRKGCFKRRKSIRRRKGQRRRSRH